MIPKIIHYCWFGKNPLDDMAKKCMESWRKFCPDYEIKEWNEENFDINSNRYVKEAYEAKKWAFVSDYVRLYALKNFGGIYMDTDVELLKNLDEFLQLSAFTGFEQTESMFTALVGCEKNSEIFSHLLSYYDGRSFFLPNGQMDLTTNTVIVTNMLQNKYNLLPNNQYQEIPGVVALFPKDYFCPKSYETGEIHLTENTVCIHHFNSSWISKFEKHINEKRLMYMHKYGKEKGNRKYSRWLKRNRLFIYIDKNGVRLTIKKIFQKLKIKGVK